MRERLSRLMVRLIALVSGFATQFIAKILTSMFCRRTQRVDFSSPMWPSMSKPANPPASERIQQHKPTLPRLCDVLSLIEEPMDTFSHRTTPNPDPTSVPTAASCLDSWSPQMPNFQESEHLKLEAEVLLKLKEASYASHIMVEGTPDLPLKQVPDANSVLRPSSLALSTPPRANETHKAVTPSRPAKPTRITHRNAHVVKKYACHECDKSFQRPSALARHALIHSGERPFVCDFDGCGKSFSAKGNLKTHHRIHTGERPFACPFRHCSRSFNQGSHLARHKSTHERDLN